MIREEFKDLDKLRDQFDPTIISKALNSAIRKTAKKARTFVSKEIRKKYNVKAKKISRALIELRVRNPKDLVTDRVLQYTGGKISLINFGARKTRVKGGKRKGVSVLVKKTSGRKIVKGEDGYGAFIGVGKNFNTQVFLRETKSRKPIRKLSGPSIAEMIETADILKKIDDFVGVEMPKQLDHELEFFLTKAGAI